MLFFNVRIGFCIISMCLSAKLTFSFVPYCVEEGKYDRIHTSI